MLLKCRANDKSFGCAREIYTICYEVGEDFQPERVLYGRRFIADSSSSSSSLREKFYIFITHCEIDRKAPAACTLIRKLENVDHATRRMKIIIESLEGFDLRINETKMMKWSLMSIIYVFNSHDFVSKNNPPSPSSFSCFFGVYCLISVTYSIFVNLYMPNFLC